MQFCYISYDLDELQQFFRVVPYLSIDRAIHISDPTFIFIIQSYNTQKLQEWTLMSIFPKQLNLLANQQSTKQHHHNEHLSNCRICLSAQNGKGDHELINFCACKGSVGFIHQTCLCCWINTLLFHENQQSSDILASNSIKCQLCKSVIPLEITKIYTVQSKLDKKRYMVMFAFFIGILLITLGLDIFMGFQLMNLLATNQEEENKQKTVIHYFAVCILTVLVLCQIIFIFYKFFVDMKYSIHVQHKGKIVCQGTIEGGADQRESINCILENDSIQVIKNIDNRVTGQKTND